MSVAERSVSLETYCLRPDSPRRRWLLVGLRYRGSGGGRELVRGYRGRPHEHLERHQHTARGKSSQSISLDDHPHTSFGDLGECQAGTSLKVDVFGKDQGTQGTKGLAGEEVGLAALASSQYDIGRMNGGYVRFRGTEAGPPQPPAHYRRGRVRKGHRGTVLGNCQTGIVMGRDGAYLRSKTSCRYPWPRQRAQSL